MDKREELIWKKVSRDKKRKALEEVAGSLGVTPAKLLEGLNKLAKANYLFIDKTTPSKIVSEIFERANLASVECNELRRMFELE